MKVKLISLAGDEQTEFVYEGNLRKAGEKIGIEYRDRERESVVSLVLSAKDSGYIKLCEKPSGASSHEPSGALSYGKSLECHGGEGNLKIFAGDSGFDIKIVGFSSEIPGYKDGTFRAAFAYTCIYGENERSDIKIAIEIRD